MQHTRPFPQRPRRLEAAAGEGGVCGPQSASASTRDYANRVTPPPQSRADETAAARRLWELQDAAQRLTPHRYALDRDGDPIEIEGRPGEYAPSALRKCRRVRVGPEVHVSVLDGRASTEGLATCRSVWECPCCSRRVRQERADTVREVVRSWEGEGGHAYLATFTIKHGFSDNLGHTFGGISSAWQRMQRGKSWQKWKSQGIESVRSFEVTHGQHGWHPHIHAVFLSPVELDEDAVSAWLTERWKRAVRAELGEQYEPHASSDGVERGTDFRKLMVEDYVVKIGAEITDAGAAKRAKKGNRTPWEILASAAAGDPADTMLWREYAVGAKGKRFLTWSKGLRRRKETAEHQLEVDQAAEREASQHVDTLTAREWDSLRDLPDFRCELLLAAVEGRGSVLEVLREFKSLRDSLNRARAGPSA